MVTVNVLAVEEWGIWKMDSYAVCSIAWRFGWIKKVERAQFKYPPTSAEDRRMDKPSPHSSTLAAACLPSPFASHRLL